MKYQFKILKKVFIKNLLPWYFLLFFVVVIYNWNLDVFSLSSLTKSNFYNSLGLFYNLNDFANLQKYLFFWQIFITIFSFVSYIEYDIHNSIEFIFFRIKKEKWLNIKLFLTSILILIIRTIYFVLIFFQFYNKIKITLWDYLLPICLHETILLVIYLIYRFKLHFNF